MFISKKPVGYSHIIIQLKVVHCNRSVQAKYSRETDQLISGSNKSADMAICSALTVSRLTDARVVSGAHERGEALLGS